MKLNDLVKKVHQEIWGKIFYVRFGGYIAKGELDQTNKWKIFIDNHTEPGMIEIGTRKQAIQAAKEALVGHYLAIKEMISGKIGHKS